MVVFTSIRQSPAYLYLKAYCLCALVTLFQTTPVSSRLPQIGESLHLRHQYRGIQAALNPRVIPDERRRITSPSRERQDASPTGSDNDRNPPPAAARSPTRVILKRWYLRALDLAQIKKLLLRDDKDLRTYPELAWDATVRRSRAIHPDEKRFIKLRAHRISCQGAGSLRKFLDLAEGEEVDPRDVPLVALAGSGGGYRAMYGFAAFMSASKKLGLWDCLTWAAGVSGSCWTLAAYYTIANHDFSKLIRHYLSVAKETAHPLSLRALDTIARSRQGVYFLIGPLVRKVRSGSGIIGLGIMDLYATLTTTYQFLSREPGARLSRSTFQFSKVWSRSGIDKGAEPMPIFTAVRRAPKNSSGVRPHTDSSISRGQPPKRALKQHQTAASTMISDHQKSLDGRKMEPSAVRDTKPADYMDSSLGKRFFQWFEISPLEVGSPDINAWIPTWSWGRSFASGRSFDRRPEQSLSLILGQCTSAPAGPLTGYISALLASLPKGTFMSRVLLLINDFARMKRWERLWANPIRSGHDPNPFYGPNFQREAQPSEKETADASPTSSSQDQLSQTDIDRHLAEIPPQGIAHTTTMSGFNPGLDGLAANKTDIFERNDGDGGPPSAPSAGLAAIPTWESQGRIQLMDSGMSNNLPNHILARPERDADIIIAFDASSDVKTGSAVRRIHNFADDCHIELEDQTALFVDGRTHLHVGKDTAETRNAEGEPRLLEHYARVFYGRRESGRQMYVIYCPLLPNGINPGFDPSTAAFSTSYNLVWTPDQIKALFATSEANLSRHAIETIKKVTTEVYRAKRAQRLAPA